MSQGLFVNLTTWSYTACIAAFAALAVLLFMRRSVLRQTYRLAVATITTIAWAAVVIAQANSDKLPFLLIYTAEVLRDGAWIFLISAFAVRAGRVKLARFANLSWII